MNGIHFAMWTRRGLAVLAVAGLVASGVTGVTAFAAPATEACPWVGSSAPLEQRVDQVLSRLTPTEKLGLVHGSGSVVDILGPTSYAGIVKAVPRLCIPQLSLSDGTAGVGGGKTGVTQLPAPNSLAAAWDRSLAAAYGDVVGEEMRGKGANIALGPTLDLARDPRAGRSFETLGEDPELTGALAVPQIRAIQGNGLIAQAKHLAAYNQEALRDTALGNAVVDERTLQEIYLPAFEDAVREGDVGSVMCGYNFVNGVHACNNTYLLSQVLKGQFGFDGFVTSDWFAMHASVAAANAGLDMQMPGSCYFGTRLGAGIAAGQVPAARLDDMVRRILRPMFERGIFENPVTGTPDVVVTSPAHAAVARVVAEQGTVLLKNEQNVLPLSGSGSVAVIGNAAGAGVLGSGGGSVHVLAPSIVTPYQGIAARAGGRVTFDDGGDRARAASVAKAAGTAVVFVAKWSSESKDNGDIALSDVDNKLIEAVSAANPNTVVVLNTGGPVTMPWLSKVRGVFAAWYPGQEYGNAIASLLFGDTNPSAKLPITFPTGLDQVPAKDFARFPGGQYTEGLAVGYRWYDQQKLNPLFPFGFGLSYTDFSFDGLSTGPVSADGAVTVGVNVTNTGSRAGAEVAQVYLSHPASDGEPPRLLKGFEKVELNPGETKQVHFTLDARAFSHWDSSLHQWIRSAGTYAVWVGDSSRHLPLTSSIQVPTTIATSAPTPPAPQGAPTGGDSLSGAVANLAACPDEALFTGLTGLTSLLGLPPGPQATVAPANP
ncbi:MAG: beta-glucosidase [Actinomycetota bacterium]|nr:beta-glucosidase [Actinomycetota bacterium]